ncbi:MAG: MerR family transcriptional regulator [Chloroflexi bacterium]|nr:MerR family transcriptional regulator [Chloroflexota bacterium]
MQDERDGREALARVLVANDGEVLGRLRLSAAEAARVCGVTPRQIIYWTKRGIIQPSQDGSEDYDVFALEKAIRIRLALASGRSLEKAAQQVDRELADRTAELDRLSSLDGEALEAELRRRLERLEARVADLRHMLPATLGVARLRRAVAVLSTLEAHGTLTAATGTGDAAKLVAARLGRAVDELESLLREVEPATA